MLKRKTYHAKISQKIGAFLLMVLFLAIPLIQTLHSDHPNHFCAEKSVSIAAEKCLICDYTAHIKGKQILTAHVPVIHIPNQVCAVLNTFVFTRIYHHTLSTFGNKGPPSLT